MPTRSEYVAYAKSFIGSYGAGAGHAENDVPFNTKYYGRRVSGSRYSWCRVFEWCIDDHFGIADLNGGKTASCPDSVRVGKNAGAKTWHKPKHGSPAYQAGNKVLYDFNDTDESEHTGIFVAGRDSRSFWAVEGNTGNDQVALRIRFYSDVLDVVETLGLGSKNGDQQRGSVDMPDYISLTTKEPVAVTMGEDAPFVLWDVERSDDAKRHVDRASQGIFVAGSKGTLYEAFVRMNGPATWELCEMQQKDGEWIQKDSNTGGPDLADPGSHLWLRLHPVGTGLVTVSVKCFAWDR